MQKSDTFITCQISMFWPPGCKNSNVEFNFTHGTLVKSQIRFFSSTFMQNHMFFTNSDHFGSKSCHPVVFLVSLNHRCMDILYESIIYVNHRGHDRGKKNTGVRESDGGGGWGVGGLYGSHICYMHTVY